MKSHINKLKNRGYIPVEDIRDYEDLNKNELLELLKAKEPYKRTIVVNLLWNKYKLDNEMINIFCNMLSREKKLYTKIELCNALELGNIFSAKTMVKYLGKIGNNRHKELPNEAKRSLKIIHSRDNIGCK